MRACVAYFSADASVWRDRRTVGGEWGLTLSLPVLVSLMVLLVVCATSLRETDVRVSRRRSWLLLFAQLIFEWPAQCALPLFHNARFRNRNLFSNLLKGTIPDSIGSALKLTQLCVLIICVSVQAESGSSTCGADVVCCLRLFELPAFCALPQ